ncbi:MAG: hypothetical protein ACREMY_23850 [bacterium]
MNKRSRSGFAIAALGLLHASTAAWAQSVGSLRVTFDGGGTIAALPISSWSVLCASAGIILSVAIYRLRRRGRETSSLRSWALLAVLTGGMAGALYFGTLAHEVSAQVSPTPFALVSSPATIVISGVPSTYLATNESGSTITLTAMSIDNRASCENIAIPPTTCSIGTQLAPGASCLIGVTYMLPPCV